MTTMTDFPRPKLRHRVDPSELVILAKVAATGKYGFMVECGRESGAEQILVEDGYLTCDVKLGLSHSYSCFQLTEMGRKALALRSGQ